MLMGDDDTMFFIPGVLKLLQEYDHEMPYGASPTLHLRAPQLQAHSIVL